MDEAVAVGAVDVNVAVEDERRVIVELPNVDPAADKIETELYELEVPEFVDELVMSEPADDSNRDEVLETAGADVELNTEEVVKVELMNELPAVVESEEELNKELLTELSTSELVVGTDADDVRTSTVDVELRAVVIVSAGTSELATAELQGIIIAGKVDEELRIEDEESRIKDEELDTRLGAAELKLSVLLGDTTNAVVDPVSELNKTLLDD